MLQFVIPEDPIVPDPSVPPESSTTNGSVTATS